MTNPTAQLLEQHFDTAFSAPNGIKKLRELMLTLAMQGKLLPKTSEWTTNKLKTLTTKIGSGSTPSGGKNAYQNSGIPLIRSMNVHFEGFNAKGLAYLNEYQAEKLKNVVVQENDVLLNITGASIGRVTTAPSEMTGARVNQHVCIIRLNEKVEPKFLVSFLSSPLIQNMIIDVQVGATREALTKGMIEQFDIPLPPIAEQQRIVAKIDELMAKCDALEALQQAQATQRTQTHQSAIQQLLTTDDTPTAWQFLKTHFETLYQDKANVKELRKAILQLAVMGKLVPQDPKDQPASELLKEITAEKEHLVKEGKIKKQKPLPAIDEAEKPYPLPQGWEWVRLGEVVDVGTGSTPATTNSEYYNGNIPWYTSSATNNLIASKPETFITEKALEETNCKIFPAGSLIIALYGQGKTRGQISELALAGATNQAIAAMVFYNSSKPTKAYLKYFFIKMYEEIRALAEGAAQPNLNVGKIKEALIPLPPLAEQQRIVAKIDQLMSLCDQLEARIDERMGKQSDLLNALMASCS